MKIEGYDNCVNKISLRHKGKNVRFDCYVKPFLCEKRLDLERPKVAKIEFDDLREVDSMIEMLSRFRKECEECIGEWNRYEQEQF